MRILTSLAALAFTAWTLVVLGTIWLVAALGSTCEYGCDQGTRSEHMLLAVAAAIIAAGTLAMLVGLVLRTWVAAAGLLVHFVGLLPLHDLAENSDVALITTAALLTGSFAVWGSGRVRSTAHLGPEPPASGWRGRPRLDRWSLRVERSALRRPLVGTYVIAVGFCVLAALGSYTHAADLQVAFYAPAVLVLAAVGALASAGVAVGILRDAPSERS